VAQVFSFYSPDALPFSQLTVSKYPVLKNTGCLSC